VVVALIDGLVKLVFPESNADPPVGAAYQSIVEPPGGVAVTVTVPVPHLDELPAVGAVGDEFTVAVTERRPADIHPVVVFLAWAKKFVVALIDGVVNGVPDPSNVPPVAASYQSIIVPATDDAEIETVPGPHLEPTTGVVGLAGTALTVAVTDVLVVEIHPVVELRAWAKYCVVPVIDGVVKDVLPESKSVPPVAAEYQSIVSPAPGVAEIVTVPVPQRDPGVPLGDAGKGLIVAVTGVLVDTHPVEVFRVSA
jgi:hypothetical protein